MIRTEAELRAWAEANYAALNRRDWDALFTDTDPAVEWDPVEENVSYRGRHAILEYFERGSSCGAQVVAADRAAP